jgi:hypothetical protein
MPAFILQRDVMKVSGPAAASLEADLCSWLQSAQQPPLSLYGVEEEGAASFQQTGLSIPTLPPSSSLCIVTNVTQPSLSYAVEAQFC